MRFLIISALLAVAFAQDAHQDHQNHEEHKVDVDVYYESLCPDSRKFFTNQLYPALQKNLSMFVNLNLVPYGKSEMNKTGDNIMFKCHHGEAECEGNKIQACALRHIEDGKNTQGLGYNKIAVAFINCLMDKATRDGDKAKFPIEECGTVNNVKDIIKTIEDCSKNPEGSDLLFKMGKMTEELNPKLKSVPTVIFNKMQKDDDISEANSNFVKALCQYIKGDKPAECNGASVLNFSLLAAFVAVAAYFY